MGSEMFHAVDVVLQRIGFDTIAVVIMIVSLLGMLVAVTLCDGGGAHRHVNAG